MSSVCLFPVLSFINPYLDLALPFASALYSSPALCSHCFHSDCTSHSTTTYSTQCFLHCPVFPTACVFAPSLHFPSKANIQNTSTITVTKQNNNNNQKTQ